MKRLLVAMAASCLLIAGCSSGAGQESANLSGTSAPSEASEPAPASTHQLSVGELSVTVPKDWSEGDQVTLRKESALEFHGDDLFPTMSPNDGEGAIDSPLNESPYVSEVLTVHKGKADLNLTEVSADGEFYVLNITVPDSEIAELKKVAASIKTPPVATATDIVRFMEQAMPLTKAQVGSSRWILAGGEPGASSKQFALYRSIDDGKTWSLAAWTSYNGGSPFVGRDAGANMFFWTENDGVIVQSGGVIEKRAFVYYTADAGSTWGVAELDTPGQPEKTTITLEPSGNVLLAIHLHSGGVYEVTSGDGGKTWAESK